MLIFFLLEITEFVFCVCVVGVANNSQASEQQLEMAKITSTISRI